MPVDKVRNNAGRNISHVCCLSGSVRTLHWLFENDTNRFNKDSSDCFFINFLGFKSLMTVFKFYFKTSVFIHRHNLKIFIGKLNQVVHELNGTYLYIKS